MYHQGKILAREKIIVDKFFLRFQGFSVPHCVRQTRAVGSANAVLIDTVFSISQHDYRRSHRKFVYIKPALIA